MQNNSIVYAFETDTVWGLGADINNPEGINKIYEIKHRDKLKPLILMSNNLENIQKYIMPLPVFALNIVKKYFPSALTIIVKKSKIFPSYLNPEFDTVGVRIPNHKGFADFCKKNDNLVLATTSANISNETPFKNREEVVKKLNGNVHIVDETILNKNTNTPSTIVLIGDNNYKVLRQGEIYL